MLQQVNFNLLYFKILFQNIFYFLSYNKCIKYIFYLHIHNLVIFPQNLIKKQLNAPKKTT